MQQSINFYNDTDDNDIIKIFHGTKLFNETIYSQIPSVFIGSKESGLLICKSILLANGFKNLEFNSIDNIDNELTKNKFVFYIDEKLNLKNHETQTFLFYLLEMAKRDDISIAFLIDNSITLTSTIPSEIHSRLFSLNTIRLTLPSIEDIKIIMENTKDKTNKNILDVFKINRDYDEIKNTILF